MFFIDSPPLRYVEPVFRPPSEAQSLLLQVTIGCSHNQCTFCAMYRTKRFALRSIEDIQADLQKAARYYGQAAPRKIFLCDGDALAAPAKLLLQVLEQIKISFPAAVRVGVYASARNVLRKSDEELRQLVQAGLKIAYLGVESGCDQVLALIKKGVTCSETIEACQRLKKAGFKISEIVMLGVGGLALSLPHARESARLVSATGPNFLSFLTTVVVPETPYEQGVASGAIEPLSTRQLLEEMRAIIAEITGDQKIILRANHVSNMFPIEGILPRDKKDLLKLLAGWIDECPEGQYPVNDPHFL